MYNLGFGGGEVGPIRTLSTPFKMRKCTNRPDFTTIPPPPPLKREGGGIATRLNFRIDLRIQKKGYHSGVQTFVVLGGSHLFWSGFLTLRAKTSNGVWVRP